MTFAEFIRGERESRGWLVKELADRAGFSAPYVSCVECGKKNPRIGNAIRLARALGVPIGRFEWVDESYKPTGFARRLYGTHTQTVRLCSSKKG